MSEEFVVPSFPTNKYLRRDEAVPGEGGSWGSITGTLSDQTDLQTALDAKAVDADVVHDTGNETIAGVKTFSSDPLIPDEAYGAGWNGSLEPPTKNAVYDKIETISGGSPGGSDTQIQFNDSSSFGGDSALIWDKTNDQLGIGGSPDYSLDVTGAGVSTTARFEALGTGGKTMVLIKGTANQTFDGAPTTESVFYVKDYNDVTRAFIRQDGFVGANKLGTTDDATVVISQVDDGFQNPGINFNSTAGIFWDAGANWWSGGQDVGLIRSAAGTIKVSNAAAGSGNLVVADDAYDATTWNGNLAVPTKNAIRDKIQTFITGQTYTESNVTTDRSFNANSTSVDELADVLGTLIADLRSAGIIN